jgi:serine/threonine protein kinase
MTDRDKTKKNNKNKECNYLKFILASNNTIGSYKILETIGEGTFGKVKLGIHIPTEEKVNKKY